LPVAQTKGGSNAAGFREFAAARAKVLGRRVDVDRFAAEVLGTAGCPRIGGRSVLRQRQVERYDDNAGAGNDERTRNDYGNLGRPHG
jgi:hypothetical protein